MKIKEGFNGKESELLLNVQSNNTIELWIRQTGLPEGKAQETLSYLTPTELQELFVEVQRAGKDLFS